MAITINSVSRSNGMPSASQRVQVLNVDMDASYPTGGENISAQLSGGAVVWSETKPHYDGTDLRWFKVSAAGLLQSFEDASGAPGTETSNATDLSGHTGLEVAVATE